MKVISIVRLLQQTQKKLPYIEANYRLQIQSNTRLNLLEMEQKQAVESSHEVPLLNEIPLASLVSLRLPIVNFTGRLLYNNLERYLSLLL